MAGNSFFYQICKVILVLVLNLFLLWIRIRIKVRYGFGSVTKFFRSWSRIRVKLYGFATLLNAALEAK